MTSTTSSTRSGSRGTTLAGRAIRATSLAALIGLGLTTVATTTITTAAAATDDTPIARWSDRIWSAAKSGDAQTLEESFANVPESGVPGLADRIRERIAERAEHRQAAEDDLGAQRDAARTKLSEALANDEVTQALTAAVELQTISDDWNAVLDEELVNDLVVRAEALDATAQEDGDLLLSQEVLFRLRTLYEDTGRIDRYRELAARLDKVNRRIGLLAQYAPRTLHELRSAAAERIAPDEEFPAFNEAFAEDWKDQLDGISRAMLVSGLATAASEHISNAGWKPLLLGGVEALRIFSTTSTLADTFPGLGRAKDVEMFDGMLELMYRQIEEDDPRVISRSTFTRLLGEVLYANERTLKVPEDVILREFGDGAMYRIQHDYEDQYSELIWPDRLRRFKQQVDGAFVGVGIIIRHDDMRRIMIVNPLEGSPAARSGVKEGDIIVGVDGRPTTGWGLNRAVDEITGPQGEIVRLKVERDGVEDPIELPIERAEIKMRSVNGWWKESLDDDGDPEWSWFADPMAGIGYVRLTSFNDDSFTDFMRAIDAMKQERTLRGLVLDLRYNPGGLLRSAVEFSNLFVSGGSIVSGQDRSGRTVWELSAQPNRSALADIPTVVLINQGSASASEIVAGCLQAHDAAVILGERSFGKGSVQTVHDISTRAAEAAVKLTTQYYVLPPVVAGESGRLVHKKPGADDWGVNPDIEVPMSPEQIQAAIELRRKADLIADWIDEAEREERPEVDALVREGLDPQLEMALLLLQARALKDLEAQQLARRD